MNLEANLLAWIDDVYVGEKVDVSQCFADLLDNLPTGMEVSTRKTLAYSAKKEFEWTPVGVQKATEGIMVCGSPVGPRNMRRSG